MKSFAFSFQYQPHKLFAITSLSFLLTVASNCKQSTSPAPALTPTPLPSVTKVLLPIIRTTEVVIDFTQPLLTEAQQNIQFTPRGLTIGDRLASAQLSSKPLVVTLEHPAPFLALSAKWSSVIAPEAKLTISARAATEQHQWSEWQRSSLDGDPHTQAGLFFFSPDSKFIQYRLEMEGDVMHRAPLLQSLKLRFISPGATLPTLLSKLKVAMFLRRTEWDCPVTNFQTKRQPGQAQHLIVHHTATANDVQDWPAVVRTIWNFHAFTNSWRDLGYHYLIDPNGVIYEGRAGGERAAGIHFSCANTGTLGIAMLGNFTAEPPTEQAQRSLQSLLAQKAAELKLEPVGASYHASTGLTLPRIAGHRDANASKIRRVCAGTQCPGDALYALLPELRAKVKGQLTNHTQPFLEIPPH